MITIKCINVIGYQLSRLEQWTVNPCVIGSNPIYPEKSLFLLSLCTLMNLDRITIWGLFPVVNWRIVRLLYEKQSGLITNAGQRLSLALMISIQFIFIADCLRVRLSTFRIDVGPAFSGEMNFLLVLTDLTTISRQFRLLQYKLSDRSGYITDIGSTLLQPTNAGSRSDSDQPCSNLYRKIH